MCCDGDVYHQYVCMFVICRYHGPCVGVTPEMLGMSHSTTTSSTSQGNAEGAGDGSDGESEHGDHDDEGSAGDENNDVEKATVTPKPAETQVFNFFILCAIEEPSVCINSCHALTCVGVGVCMPNLFKFEGYTLQVQAGAAWCMVNPTPNHTHASSTSTSKTKRKQWHLLSNHNHNPNCEQTNCNGIIRSQHTNSDSNTTTCCACDKATIHWSCDCHTHTHWQPHIHSNCVRTN